MWAAGSADLRSPGGVRWGEGGGREGEGEITRVSLFIRSTGTVRAWGGRRGSSFFSLSLSLSPLSSIYPSIHPSIHPQVHPNQISLCVSLPFPSCQLLLSLPAHLGSVSLHPLDLQPQEQDDEVRCRGVCAGSPGGLLCAHGSGQESWRLSRPRGPPPRVPTRLRLSRRRRQVRQAVPPPAALRQHKRQNQDYQDGK